VDSTLENLIALAKCDHLIQEAQRKCDAFPISIAEVDQQIQTARNRIETARNDLKEVDRKIRKNEQSIEDSRQQQGKYRVQLFKLKSNREYNALNSEIKLLDEKISQYETEILEFMETLDKTKTQLRELESAIKVDEAQLQARKAEIESEFARERSNLSALQNERKGYASVMVSETAMRYDRLVKKQGSAVAEIIKGSCGGCRVRVRPQLSAQVRANDQLLQCEHCGRFLYWSDVSDD